MLSLIVYGVYRLQETRGRPVRRTELLDLYYLLQKRFGVTLYDTEEEYVEALERLAEAGYLEKSGNSYAVTEAGKRVAESLECSSYASMLREYVDRVVEDYANIPRCGSK